METNNTIDLIDLYVDEAAGLMIELSRTQPELAEKLHAQTLRWRELTYTLLGDNAPDSLQQLKRYLDKKELPLT